MKKTMIALLIAAMFLFSVPLVVAPVSATPVCGTSIATLYAGQDIAVGTVTVDNDVEKIVVTFDIDLDDWYLLETHVALTVADPLNPDNYANPLMKQTKNGNPIPGQFPLGNVFDITDYVTGDVVSVTLDEIGAESDDCVFVAAHAKVAHVVSGSIDIDSDENTKVIASSNQTIPAGGINSVVPASQPWGEQGFCAESKWIWESDPSLDPEFGSIVTFQEQVEIPGLYFIDVDANLMTSADNGYELLVNGVSIGMAQLAANYDTALLLTNDIVWWYDTPGNPYLPLPYGWSTAETWNIGGALDTGTNFITVIGVNEYQGPLDTPSVPVTANPAAIRYCGEVAYEVVDQEASAWAGEGDFNGANWATFFCYSVEEASFMVDWNLSAAVMPVPPYGSIDIPDSDDKSELAVSKLLLPDRVGIAGEMDGLSPNTQYTVYLSKGYTPYVFTGWNVAGSYVVGVEWQGITYPENLVLTQSGTDITGTSLSLVSPPGGSLFTVTAGSVIGNAIDIVMNRGTLVVHMEGTIASDGTMSGTWHDEAPATRSGTWATTSGTAVKTHTGSMSWPGLFTSTVQPFTFMTDAAGKGTWNIVMNDGNFPGSGTYVLSVWINVGATILISDNFSVTVE